MQLTRRQTANGTVLAAVVLALAGLRPSAAGADGAVPLVDHDEGRHTEAAWSPDGRQVVYQSERGGLPTLRVVDLTTGRVRALVEGAGQACHPAWSPDGQWIAYTHASFPRTVAQGLENGYNIFVVPAARGEPRRLTAGVHRDYTPTFSLDGDYVYFSSTRTAKENSVGLWRVPLIAGEPEPVLLRDAPDVAFVQPDFSPDGRFIACGHIAGFRSNWTLRLIREGDPPREYPLTDTAYPMYGPRWSRDGGLIACTGYRPGDPGWGIYLVEVSTGRLARLDTGPGNSRSPAWSPDGKELLFENNRSGDYRLYRLRVPAVSFQEEEAPEPAPAEPVVRFSFARGPAETLTDLSGNGNNGTIVGKPGRADDGWVFGDGQYVQIQDPRGLEFGTGAFSVKATIRLDRTSEELRMLVVGDYPVHHLGWQLYVDKEGHAWFNSRSPAGNYVGARSDRPLDLGRRVTLAGLRHPSGKVELYVDGLRQGQTGVGATMFYPAPTQVRIGTQFNGTIPFAGTVYELEVWRGLMSTGDSWRKGLQEFLEG